MYKIIEGLPIMGKTILTLDKPRPLKEYNSYRIDGKIYKPISVTGSNRWIAINEIGDFVGKEVEFITA